MLNLKKYIVFYKIKSDLCQSFNRGTHNMYDIHTYICCRATPDLFGGHYNQNFLFILFFVVFGYGLDRELNFRFLLKVSSNYSNC